MHVNVESDMYAVLVTYRYLFKPVVSYRNRFCALLH
jgi:hypothetical protein